jgi:F420-non-reducing hydrogenase iron-sulfur subunit
MEQNPIRIVVYHCRNLQLFRNGEQKEFARLRPGLRLVAVPCSGKVEAHHLLKTLAGGADGALVIACEERACQYMEGSMRSHKRVDYARSWLAELGIDPARVAYTHVPPMDSRALDTLLKDFGEKLEPLGKVPSAETPSDIR